MAHQTKSNVSVQYGPRQILERADLAALLGAVAAEWSLLEERVTFFYSYLMGRYLPRVPGYSPPIHPVALQVFDTLETQRLRLDLLKKLAKWMIKDTSLLDELEKSVIDGIWKASKLRNTLVHGKWGIAKEYPDALILLPIFGHQLVYKAEDFNQAIDLISEASKNIGQFEVKVRAFLEGNDNAEDKQNA